MKGKRKTLIDVVRDAIARGASTVEEVVKSVSDMPLKKLGKLDPTKRLRKVQNESIGTVGEAIRDINEQVRAFAADRLAQARKAGLVPGAKPTGKRRAAKAAPAKRAARAAPKKRAVKAAPAKAAPAKQRVARAAPAKQRVAKASVTVSPPAKPKAAVAASAASPVAKRPAVARKRVARPAPSVATAQVDVSAPSQPHEPMTQSE